MAAPGRPGRMSGSARCIMAEPHFFPTPTAFRAWLEANHERQTELLVGFYKVGSGRPSITWPESVDQALCFGWIDGIRQSLGNDAYTIRFTPRKARSNWSAVNVKRAEELTKMGLMREAGLRAFEARPGVRTAPYSYENRDLALPQELEQALRENAAAWAFFEKQPPGYRRTVAFWVMDARRQETRLRRLKTLIDDCEAGRRVGILAGPRSARRDG